MKPRTDSHKRFDARLGNSLRIERESAEMSQQELADAVSSDDNGTLSRAMLAGYETGGTSIPAWWLARICDVLPSCDVLILVEVALGDFDGNEVLTQGELM